LQLTATRVGANKLNKFERLFRRLSAPSDGLTGRTAQVGRALHYRFKCDIDISKSVYDILYVMSNNFAWIGDGARPKRSQSRSAPTWTGACLVTAACSRD